MANDETLDAKSVSETFDLSDKETQKMLSKNAEFAAGLVQNINKLEQDKRNSKEFADSMEGISTKRSAFYWKTMGAYPALFTEILKGNKYALIILIIFILITLATSLYQSL